MNKINTKRELLKYTIWGFLFGLLLVFIITVVVLGRGSVPVTRAHIIDLHRNNLLIQFINFLPLVFALGALIVGRRFATYAAKLFGYIKKESAKANRILHFAEQLTAGQLTTDYTVADEDDKLGQSLIDLRDSLKKSKEDEEKRRKEDQQRHWANEGLASFSEILRQNNDNMEVLAYNIINKLVKYTNSNQGGFFILHAEEETDKKYFELQAHVAYGRKKYNHKTLEWGEGLIGRSCLERLPIFMTDVPDNYVDVTSGLGTSNPRCILIQPLIINEEVHGVIELASFNIYENYQREFIEKLGESIASTISTVKINLRTSKLLKESQIQADKLAKQEEELRQKMDQLRKTQKEAARQSEAFVSFTNSVNHTMIRAEYNTKGILLYANSKFIDKMGYSASSEVEGQHISLFIGDKDIAWFNRIWEGLARGGRHFENYMKHVTKQGTDLWTMATYTCVRNAQGGVDKILFLAIDTTEAKKQSLDYEGQIEALNRTNLKLEIAPDGRIIDANNKYMELMSYTIVELKNKSIFQFIDKDILREFKHKWQGVLEGHPYEGQLRQITQLGEERWLQVTFSAVNDMYGDVAKIILIANDITEQKKMEIQTQKQTEKLKQQEERLRQSQVELSHKLQQARTDMKEQYKEIEASKIRHEKTLEGTLDAVITVNQDGIIQFFNHAAEELFGLSRGKVLNNHLRLLLPPPHAKKSEKDIHKFLTEDIHQYLRTRTEVNITNQNGEEIPVLITLAEAKVSKETTFTAFIQNVSIELF